VEFCCSFFCITTRFGYLLGNYNLEKFYMETE